MAKQIHERRYRITLVIDIEGGLMDEDDASQFIKWPEGAHYAVDYGQLVSSKAEEIRDGEADRS